MYRQLSRSFFFFFSLFILTISGAISCAPTLFPIGGTASGLSGALVLQNNGGDNLTISTDGTFTFSTGLALNSTYAVTVLTAPSGQTCTVSNGQGTVSGTVSNIVVTCSGSSQTYTLGGSVSGLTGTVVLQNSDSQQVSVSADGSFQFANALADAAPYAVTVATQPAGQTCTVNDGSGTISGANVTNVSVTCSALTYSVGGTVSGLTGTVVLQNNGGDDLSVSADGAFTFSTELADGSGYAVSVLTQPSGQLCEVTNAGGTISGADVTDVTVTCISVLKIFLTKGNYGSGASGIFTFDSVAAADAKCLSDFSYPGTGIYKALIVSGSGTRVACTTPNCTTLEGTDWVLGADTTYVRSDGSTIIGTTNSGGIFTFPLENTFSSFTSGTPWTGLSTDWTTSADTCMSWTSNLGASNGIVGDMSQTTSTSISLFANPCKGFNSLLCVEQP